MIRRFLINLENLPNPIVRVRLLPKRIKAVQLLKEDEEVELDKDWDEAALAENEKGINVKINVESLRKKEVIPTVSFTIKY
jgi:hypothetical protein